MFSGGGGHKETLGKNKLNFFAKIDSDLDCYGKNSKILLYYVL